MTDASDKLPVSPNFQRTGDQAVRAAAQRGRIFALIGQLTFSWSNNESMFIYYLMILLKTDFPAAAITFVSLNTSRARLDLVRRLAKARCGDPAALKKLERLVEKFHEFSRVRNDFNHCIYQLDAQGHITHANVLRISEDKAGIRFADLQALDEKKIDEIVGTIRKLELLNKDLWAFLPVFEDVVKRSRQTMQTVTKERKPRNPIVSSPTRDAAVEKHQSSSTRTDGLQMRDRGTVEVRPSGSEAEQVSEGGVAAADRAGRRRRPKRQGGLPDAS